MCFFIGKTLYGYPISLPIGAAVSAPIILVDLHKFHKHQSVTGSLSPETYADPDALPWMHNSAGHQPAPAPSFVVAAKLEALNKSDTGETKSLRGKDKKTQVKSEDESETDFEDIPEAHSLHEAILMHKKHSKKTNAPAIAAEIHGGKKNKRGLHMLVSSFDGHLYVIDGRRRCAQRIDVGEHLYSTPLVDDINGDGTLDIIVGTLSGHMHVFSTNIPYHPLNSWNSFPKNRGGNGFTHGVMGVSIPQLEKKLLEYSDVRGSRNLKIVFDIWDTRKHLKTDERKYVVVFTRGTNKLEPIGKYEYSSPGRYSVELPVNPPESFPLVIGMTNDHGQYYEDHAYISVSTKFHLWIKYLILFPVTLLCLPLVLTIKKNVY